MTELKKTWFSDRAIAGGDTRRVPIQPEDCYRRPGRMTNDIYARLPPIGVLVVYFTNPGAHRCAVQNLHALLSWLHGHISLQAGVNFF